MSFPVVTKERLEAFLAHLGRTYRRATRLYLVGGTGLLYDGLKATTKDIDLAADVASIHDAEFTTALIALRNSLQIAVERVSPADFIPEPSGVALRHRYLFRTGSLDVYAYDPLATALAKLARSRAGDIEDILVLVRAKKLVLSDLRTGFDEIIPRIATEALRITESDYRRKFEAFMVLAEGED